MYIYILKGYEQVHNSLIAAGEFGYETPSLFFWNMLYFIHTKDEEGVNEWFDKASNVLNHRSLDYKIALMLQEYYKQPLSDKTLELALYVFENVQAIEDTCIILLYLYLVIDLYEMRNDDNNIIRYLKKKNAILRS